MRYFLKNQTVHHSLLIVLSSSSFFSGITIAPAATASPSLSQIVPTVPSSGQPSSNGQTPFSEQNGRINRQNGQMPFAPTPSPTSPASPNTHKLGPGDRLNLNFFNVPDYSKDYQVLSDGTLNLPLVGIVSVQGMTVQEATTELSRRYAEYLRRPVITLNLLETRPIRIAIAGQVNRPGSYSLAQTPAATPDSPQPATDNKRPTVTSVLQLAGGITQSANIREVQVRRPQRSGEESVIDVDLWELLRTGDLTQDVVLQDGDTVVVPMATALNPAEASALATASFAPTQMTVNVVGEVGSPGAVAVAPNTPLNQALLAAGGFNNRAAKGQVELVRLNPDGTASRREIEVDFAQNVDETTNPPLRNNDTIIVSRSGLARTSDTAGAVVGPVGGILGVLRFIFGF
jgi:polysaccharide biosynthesis/export protein